VVTAEPEDEDEEDDGGADNLGLFDARQGGPEGGAQGSGGDDVAENAQDSGNKAAQKVEEPEAQGYLPGSEEGEADKGRIEVDL